MSIQSITRHLARLVSFDTQDPPREITAESDIVRYCEEALDGFETRVDDYGEGRVAIYAVRGEPKVLFNVHIDTVLAGEGWTGDPLKLRVEGGKAIGRGACDIKGAAAVLLTLASETSHDMALLFTSDEEGGGGCCVAEFLEREESGCYDQVIVAEPTGCRAVMSHRGFLSVKARFHGTSGHSSEARALLENANHQMIQWSSAVLALAESKKKTGNDPGCCLNIGIVRGEGKSNVIASDSFLHLSVRLPPGHASDTFLEEIESATSGGKSKFSSVRLEVPFRGESMPAPGEDVEPAAKFASQHGLEVVDSVDFWTEAALFSAKGYPVLVLGPGHIEQAHTVDEWVELDQLQKAHLAYSRVIAS